MNKLQTSLGQVSSAGSFGPRRLFAIGLMTLTLAACGSDGAGTPSDTSSGTPPAGGTGNSGGSVPGTGDQPNGGSNGGSSGDPGDGSGDGSTSEATVLDCIRDSYPCSFSEVPLPIIERSLALSDDVAKQLGGGSAIEQVAAFLSSQSDIAEVTVDGPVLGFRLAGGRPMIVDVTGDQEMLPSTSPSAAIATNTANAARVTSATNAAKFASLVPEATALRSVESPTLRTVRTAQPTSLIGGGNKSQRHALVLSPFRYEADFGNAGELIASQLSGVRGYSGGVTYLATTNESDPQVTVDVLTKLQGYDVIHIDTHGGTLCKKKDAAVSSAAKKGDGKDKCADGVTDFLVQRFHGTAQDLQSLKHPGVIHYRGRLHQSIAVTADFFRHYYPQGLSDKLFILAACNTFRTDMADAIAGNKGVYVSWDGYTDYTLVKNTGISLADSLGLGLTVGEAFARIPPFSSENPEATGVVHRTSRQAGGDLRIRDLITVRDNLTGNVVSDASGIEVMEAPEDGKNDNLNLEFTVDGITPEQLDNFRLNLLIDDQSIGHLNLKETAVPVGDFSYRVSTVVPLSFDVEEGQQLNMDFWVPLPDTGEDHFVAAPRVNDRNNPKVGREWVLGSRLTESHHDSSTTITSAVEFEIDPNDDPARSYHYFYVKSGSVRIQRDYEDALNCRYHIDHVVDLPAGVSSNYLRFQVNGTHLVMNGFGSTPSENIQVTNSCGKTVTVNVGRAYFLAEDTVVTGDSLYGVYNDGANNPTIVEWTLDKTL